MFVVDGKTVYCHDRNKSVARWTSMKDPFLPFLKRDGIGNLTRLGQQWMSGWGGWLEQWGWNRGIMEAVTTKKEHWYLLSGRHFPLQMGQTDFKHTGEGDSEYYMLITGTKLATLWAFPETHKVLYYSETEKEKLGNTPKTEEIQALKFPVLLNRGTCNIPKRLESEPCAAVVLLWKTSRGNT